MSGIGARRAWAAQRADGVPALFPGICHCGERWAIGDHIAKRGQKWMHAKCARSNDE